VDAGHSGQKGLAGAYRARCEALDRIRFSELAAMTDEEARRRIESLVVAEPPWRERPDWSGLVEQQLCSTGYGGRNERPVGILAAAAEVEAFCRLRNWPFCFIGGIAVQRWGMPRFTQDVDLTLFTASGQRPSLSMPSSGSSPAACATHASSHCSTG